MTERTAENCIASSVLDRLIAAHDGDVALLWLYCQRHGALDEEQAAQALCRTLQEIRAAEEKLRRMELLPNGSAPVSREKPVCRQQRPLRHLCRGSPGHGPGAQQQRSAGALRDL